MADKVIGLDVGTNAVRAVALAPGEHPRLLRMGQVGLPAGAVREGEVVDPAAVAVALRRLWKEAGFKGRSVRVAIASARVILRVVDMPAMSDGDTRAALRFQLGDYIPLAPDATVFDFQPLRHTSARNSASGDNEDHEHQILLAATPRDAVQPLVDAVRQAGLKVAVVDVIAAALARTLAPSSEDPSPDDAPAQAIVSVGAGTIVVVVARAGEPLFSRTITNVSGHHVTDRLASELTIEHADAERLKRHVPDGTPADLAARVLLTTDPFITEITDEIGDSLDYFASQSGGQKIESLVLTGGGALLPGLTERLERRLHVPVTLADPFEHLLVGNKTGFHSEDLPFLAPFMSVAIGTAAGVDLGRLKQINLTPQAVGRSSLGGRARTPLLVGGLAAAVVVGGGYLYVGQSRAVSDTKADRDQMLEQVVVAQQLAASKALSAAPADERLAGVSRIVQNARFGDTDWSATLKQLDAIGDPMGVEITATTGTARVASASASAPVTGSVTPAGSAAAAATTTTTPATSVVPTTSIAPTAAAAVPPSGAVTTSTTGSATLGDLKITGTAADRNVIAAWIEAVTASPSFDAVWVDTTTEATGGLQFTAIVTLNERDLVARKLPEGVQP